jgi:hypothetical protein
MFDFSKVLGLYRQIMHLQKNANILQHTQI